MRARCCYTLQPYERWRNAHNKCNCNQFGYALSFFHPCTVIHAGVALSLCRASSGEFSKMCDTMHGREWETPLTQNFRSYLAFYYYDCFYGWFCCAVRALLILLLASRKRYYFTSFYDHHASCVPFLFSLCCETCLTGHHHHHHRLLIRSFIWSENPSCWMFNQWRPCVLLLIRVDSVSNF